MPASPLCPRGAALALLAMATSAVADGPTLPPEVLERPDAVYPSPALTEGREGTVVLQLTVSAEGRVSEVSVLESAGLALDAAAVEAAERWRFAPARRDGGPVASRLRVPFRFVLPRDGGLAPSDGGADAVPDGGAALQAGAGDGGAEAGGVLEVTARGRARAPARGTADFQLQVGSLAVVPRQGAAELLKLAPGVLLTNEGGEAHAEQVYLRGFDAREGQDLALSFDGVPINQVGNLHGNGYADTHFLIPELVESLRVLEGPFDPRQGNFAVAGSADYHLGLRRRGLSVSASGGSFGTWRALATFGPPGASQGTFLAAELYQTEGFGQNRDGRRGTLMAQLEGAWSEGRYRLTATGYLASFHAAGVLREDDLQAGRVGFFDTYDPRQGEDAALVALAAEVDGHRGELGWRLQAFGLFRNLRLRENFTGFLLDVQEPTQQPHGQRGDGLDLLDRAVTLGLSGHARWGRELFGQRQELEVGTFLRGDLVWGMQQRVEAATGHPYRTEANLESFLGNLGLHADAQLRPLSWLTLRGGVRADLFTFEVNDLCAVQSVAHPSVSDPPGDASCLAQQDFGAYRDPNQRVTTQSAVVLPRGTLLVGPFHGLTASASAGRGARSIDPGYVIQDARTPFASVGALEAGVAWQGQVEAVSLAARTSVFQTRVDQDLIFSQTAGRNVLGGATTRLGSATALRATGPFFDLQANLTWVRATFDDTGLLIPYVPELVVRADGALFGALPWRLDGRPVRGTLGLGVSWVSPRPLPYGQRGDPVGTLDAGATVSWWLLELGLQARNLLDAHYRLGEYNFASDFHGQAFPTLVPVRHFTAGAPRTLLLTLGVTLGGEP